MPIYALGDREPSIDSTAYVHPEAVLIGSVILGPGATVWPNAVLRADDNEIRIGARTSVQDGTVMHCTPQMPTIVGDDCTIGHIAHLECCTVFDHSLIGSGSVVLHGVEVGPHALVGANAVVPNNMIVPPFAMALGVPAKLRLDAVAEEHSKQNSDNYVQRGERFRRDLRRLD